MDPLAFYSHPGVMTDPRGHAYLFEGLFDDLASLCSIVQNNLVHVFWAERMGLNLTEDQKRTLQIRPVAEKLAIMAKADGRPLFEPRPLVKRQVGNCRDFSVLLCSMLRHKGIPARARCGFGAYFTPGRFEDHWVCEYWNASERRWVMVDSQLDSLQRETLNIKFDTLDVPPEMFIIAGRAWEMCRWGRSDPDKFGIFDMHGMQFIWGNVVRDFLALNKVEILPWDGGWGFLDRKLTDPLPDGETLALYDRMAEMTVEANERFHEIRANYINEPGFHVPPEWGIREE